MLSQKLRFIAACFLAIIGIKNAFTQGSHVALRPDVQVSLVKLVPAYCTRIEVDPVTGNIYYSELAGNIHRITQQGPTVKDTILFNTSNHHITTVYGMAFYDSSLYLVGNEAIGTTEKFGLIMRGKLKPNGTRTWDTLAITETFPAGNTTFDHGFGGITVSPSGDSLYIGSGSRTDHGEEENNGGLYPDVREVPLTSVVLRISSSAHNLVLPADSALLAPFIYADGLRNTFDLAFAPDGSLFGCENSGERDDPEELNWLRPKRHYGFPWVMGGNLNPQQFPGYDPDNDNMLNKNRYGYEQGFFYDDPTFPQMPPGLVITPGVNNFGPHADYFRDSASAIVMQAGDLGIALNSFTAHRSPLGIVFDNKGLLIEELKYDGFMTSYQIQGDSAGNTAAGGTGTILDPSQDVVHLQLTKNAAGDNYDLIATRIAAGFVKPVDACLRNNEFYLLEYSKVNNLVGIWKVTLPTDTLEIETGALSVSHLCPGEPVQVSFIASGIYKAGNIFTAQLSNTSGNFSSPTTIGTLNSTVSGIINAVIPSSVNAGSGYRIRVVSSNPVVTGTNNGQNIAISCPAPTGLSTTNITASSAKVKWTAVSCAKNYQIKYRETGDNWINVNANAASISKKLTGLSPSITYEWKIRTKCVTNPKVYSPYSPLQNFTTDPAKGALGNESEIYQDEVSVYPNPVSGFATIEFNIDKSEFVELSLLNIEGKKVMILAEGSYNAGNHQINFSEELSSGIYFVEFKTDQGIIMKKIAVQ